MRSVRVMALRAAGSQPRHVYESTHSAALVIATQSAPRIAANRLDSWTNRPVEDVFKLIL